MILDSKLDYQSHTRQVLLKARRDIGMIRYLLKYVSRNVLDQIYKLYVRPHFDYGDITYHRYDPEMQSHFTQALEQTHYLAALAVTGARRGTSRQKLSFHPNFVNKFVLHSNQAWRGSHAPLQ